jgi:hypothetical protein
LDDALDKLARRDELRRRAAGEATGTPPAVQELVEAIAGVVGRNQSLEVTVGVEGAGDPTLLHFFVEDNIVRVTADSSVAARVNEPRHADFDLDLEDPAEEQFAARPASPAPPPDLESRHDPFDRSGYDHQHGYDDEQTDDIEASRFRSPFAATPPPPVPPQTSRPTSPAPAHAHPDDPILTDQRPSASRNGHNGHGRARDVFGEETTRLAYAGEQSIPEPRGVADGQERGMPTPLPEPIPLRTVDSQETEQAAKRLAALLRDDPSLLRRDR